MKDKKKVLALILLTIGLFQTVSGIFALNNDNINYFKTTTKYKTLFANNKPKNEISEQSIYETKRLANQLYTSKRKDKILEKIDNLEKYMKLKDQIKSYSKSEQMISDNDINYLKSEISKLNTEYQNYINPSLNKLIEKKENIELIENNISNLFEDSNNTILKNDISLKTIEKYQDILINTKQQDVINKNVVLLNNAKTTIEKREEEKLEAIKNSWKILDVPYISQNKNNVLNGCEAATMLMSLQYKGYLQETSLYDFAVNMPKSANNNAEEGFTHDIFGYAPNNVAHWIAPSALASYGRTASMNENIMDATGMSLTELDNEIENGNPVIIYATSKFKKPKDWAEGAPKNLHVLLLVGYNKITNEQLIIDPWTHDDGKTRWILEKEKVEEIYNAVGKKSVIVR